MLPDQIQAREDAAWHAFVQHLGVQLTRAWPAMQERLGERYDAFIDHTVQQALQKGIVHAAGVARFVNLVAVWGPAFDERPGFEWARDRLAAPAEQEWLTVHQLVQRSLAELQRRPEARVDAPALARVDAQLLDEYATLGRCGAMLKAEPEALPRAACDLEAAELRLLDGEVTQEYGVEAGEWRRAPRLAPAPLRFGQTQAAPKLVSVLAPMHGPGTRLQARLRAHAVCDGDHHPAIGFAGPHGLWQWRGHETRAVSWPVATLAQPEPAAGPGTAIAEETTPEIHRLDLEVCGLRDEGDAQGSTTVQVWAWPATQWWIEIQRQSPPPQAVTAAEVARAPTRCRVESDGAVRDASGLEAGFTQGVDRACAQALQTLRVQWAQLPGLTQPALEAALGMLVGRAALTWGWRLGAQGLAGRALMRVFGQLAMTACHADLQFSGELTVTDARARIRMKLLANVPLKHELRRETEEPPLLATLLPLVARFNVPVDVELEPLASDSGRLLQKAGPATGALVGEAGLRPRTSGGSGWEWFAGLRLEPVALPVLVSDPWLGHAVQTVPLLPALTLVDWRLG